jgi:hypothetical protein
MIHAGCTLGLIFSEEGDGTMNHYPVVKNCAYCLIHVPDLVRYGSKPQRELVLSPAIATELQSHLRPFSKAVAYPPNQTFIGNISPELLSAIPRPWYLHQPNSETLETIGPFGEIMDQQTFYGLLKLADIFSPPFFEVEKAALETLGKAIATHPLLSDFSDRFREIQPAEPEYLADKRLANPCLPLQDGDKGCGYFFGDLRSEGKDDENLTPNFLLENLATKASASLALKHLIHRENFSPEKIDFLISCGEEACGDRYQRGGGGMAKAIGQMSGCVNASGFDIKNFCAAPTSALIMAASLVQAKVFQQVVVVGGGSLAKLGMKFQAFLEHDLEILDDCLAAMAFLVTVDDGQSPIIRLEPGAIGKVDIGASTSEESVFRQYLLRPLENMGLRCTDIDRYALELQNPEIMEYSGSGDVTRKNYRKIGAMAVLAKHLEKQKMQSWIDTVGMPGFAPTQGHIPSAVPYLGHAVEAIRKGEMRRVMFLSRASLFLNRCTDLLDGVSFLLERNPGLK